ncbi:glycyl radical protein [Zhenpiania hominis]|uniref:Formate C-acetyltransferase/glycerol dehydratase family glycyl radical enzyme n=1 Tax=Zhenpiania hominis TaxID=2763644 RepID=A0A923SPL5_9FIRM|nr:formate C-acetyltransferase/glycerol dehydratase family glycyl radical enzyme [Zhenpiania hominis]MBC6678505.1 formate C-acetyltransferase/glycerol dehydratase family glycyl radical enzyme [Zhenpiania hominis]
MLQFERTKEQMGTYSLDGENQFPRIERLLERYWECTPEVDVERAKIYTESYKKTEGEDVLLRRAKAFKEYCEQREIHIPEDQLIVGDTARHPRGGVVDPIFHCGWLREEVDTISTRKQDPYRISEEDKKILKEEIFPYWEGKSVSEHWIKQIPPYVRELAVKTGIIDVEIKTQSAAGETAPYWEMLFEKGLGQIKQEAREAMENLDESDPEDFAKRIFFQASLLTLEGMSAYMKRLGDLASELAVSADGERKKELVEIADNCYALMEKKPETFWQGLQFIYFILVGCLMEGNGPSYSPGRVDQYLYELYDQDIASGRLTVQKALELIEAFYIKTAETTWFLSENAVMYFAGYQPFHSLIVGGVSKHGKDVTNELSYLFLTAKMDVKLHGPSVCARVHQQSPEDFILHVAKLARLGTGFPAIYNDEVAVKMMLLSGGTMEEARNYQMVGCVEPFIGGKMAKWSDGGHYNFASAMEFVLTNGRSMMNDNRLLGLQTGNPEEMSFEEIKQAVKDQLEYMIKAISICANVNEKVCAELTPYPFVSTLLDGTYRTGKDLTAGGVKYTIGPALIGTGIADLVNSLSAIRKHVFEDETITMHELIKALESNFEGYEDMRLMLQNTTPMYGNDIEEVDELAGEMTDFAYDVISGCKSWRGPHFISGLYPVSSHVPHGLVVGALPYGRLAGKALADGCSPNGGTDHDGPTAVLKSVSKVNHEVHTSGTLLNMRLDPASVEGDVGLKRISQIIRTFVDLNIYHIQFNVVSSEVLRCAQEKPEDYKSLIVRVAGYSAYFTELCREMQDDIIHRTIHMA